MTRRALKRVVIPNTRWHSPAFQRRNLRRLALKLANVRHAEALRLAYVEACESDEMSAADKIDAWQAYQRKRAHGARIVIG